MQGVLTLRLILEIEQVNPGLYQVILQLCNGCALFFGTCCNLRYSIYSYAKLLVCFL